MNVRVIRWIAGASAAAIVTSSSPAIAASCLATATSVAFGIYNPVSSADALGAGVITVSCTSLLSGTATAAFSITISAGSGSYSARKLVSGANKLSYNIYTDAALTSVWGDGTGGSSTVSDSIQATTLGVSKTYSAYGRVPAQQSTTSAGIYADTVVVTIAY